MHAGCVIPTLTLTPQKPSAALLTEGGALIS
jgi:hypothetical protein